MKLSPLITRWVQLETLATDTMVVKHLYAVDMFAVNALGTYEIVHSIYIYILCYCKLICFVFTLLHTSLLKKCKQSILE